MGMLKFEQMETVQPDMGEEIRKMAIGKRKGKLAGIAGIGMMVFLGIGGRLLADSGTELPTITVASVKVEQENFAGEEISHALDEYVSPLIGAHVRLEFLEIERYAQIMNRYAASDVMPDVFLMLSNSSYRQWKEEGKMRNLSSLLEQYGQGILNEVPEEYFGSYMEEREIYAIPCLNDRAHAFGFEYRKKIAKRYGLPMEKVKQVSDLTEIFEMLKEKNPDMIACSNLYYSDWDVMGDGLGVLMGDGQNPEIVNLYETEEYQDYYRLLYLWEEEGYLLDEDIGYRSINNFVSSPEIFGKMAGYHPALLPIDSVDSGEDIGFIPLTPTVMRETDLNGNAYGISSSCQYPEAAMKFLNLMFSDPKVVNLLCYGIEGEHYQVIDHEKGIIDYADGVTRRTSTYSQFRTYHWGNQHLAYVWKGFPEDVWEQEIQYNDTAPRSLANGFQFNPEPVQEEYGDCLSVTSRYLPLLEGREGHVESLLEEMTRQLNEAGIDRVIQEKQRQFDAYLEAKANEKS